MVAETNGALLHPDIKDGLHTGLTRTVYESIQAVNYSTLKHFARSPAHAREYMVHPPEPTDAMDFGTAFHAAILEPARFEAEWIEAPEISRRTNAGKAEWAAFENANRGKGFLTREEMEDCRGMSEAVYRHAVAKELMSGPGKNEVAAVWTDPKTGLRCKALIDRFTRYAGWSVVVDPKTCQDARPREFARDVAKYLYHEQAAFYLGGLQVLARQDRRWLWLAIEKRRPYGVIVMEPDQETLDEGFFLVRQHLEEFANCQATNVWPCYSESVATLRLPRWALSEVENGTV